MLGRLSIQKRSSLTPKFVNNGQKSFITLAQDFRRRRRLAALPRRLPTTLPRRQFNFRHRWNPGNGASSRSFASKDPPGRKSLGRSRLGSSIPFHQVYC
jgi:hypothetical protein